MQLFDRSRQQISLTAAGERFRSHAYEVLRSARAATESICEFRGTLSGTVEFGSLISFGPLDVAAALGDFHRAHPHVRLRLHLSQTGRRPICPTWSKVRSTWPWCRCPTGFHHSSTCG